MPHIHTEPGQHDITVSACIVRYVGDTPLVLVHMHRKFGKLMQIGGHVEIDETPWQTLGHELTEESGYTIQDLQILQPLDGVPVVTEAIVHPVPALSNTHKVTADHFHSDYCYAFVAGNVPSQLPAEGESQDLRWMTIDELQQAVADGVAWQDIADIYRYVVEKCLPVYSRIDAALFSLEKPTKLK
ncbi:MAG: putative pyrophosphohydrolase including oxidative damage repair enzyme [Candidatus Saccharibacteria bacterium]|nr:putative pyrophosphohydrolase including oxidative damage repair enzyme [Candidatus Saccharibacteria bacterium]